MTQTQTVATWPAIFISGVFILQVNQEQQGARKDHCQS